MFSAEKIHFVNDRYPNSESSRKWVLSTLMLFKDYEARWGFDFTMQRYDALQLAFDRIPVSTYNGVNTTLARFRRYALWRKTVGLPCTDAVFKLQPNTDFPIRDSMVSSPEGLRKSLDRVFDDPAEETADIIYRVFLWMGFSGLSDREAVHVTGDEVDLDKLNITRGQSKYSLYKQSLRDIKAACTLDAFVDRGRLFRRTNGGEIMRGKINKRENDMDTTLTRSIRPTLARKFKAARDRAQSKDSDSPQDVALSLTFIKVSMSGMFYRLYEAEQAGNPPDFAQSAAMEYARRQHSARPFIVSKSNPEAAILLRLKKTLANDYENWKRAFRL